MIDLTRFGSLDEGNLEPMYDNIVPGGYVCVITSVENKVDKNYMRVEFDIAEGKYRDYYKNMQERVGFWGLSENKSYGSEKSIPYFKRFIQSVRDSNAGKFFNPFDASGDHDENHLIGKRIGLAIGEEEYEKNDGTIGTRMVIKYEVGTEKVSSIKPPKKKLLKKESSSSSTGFMTIPDGIDEETPFN